MAYPPGDFGCGSLIVVAVMLVGIQGYGNLCTMNIGDVSGWKCGQFLGFCVTWRIMVGVVAREMVGLPSQQFWWSSVDCGSYDFG